MKNNPSYEEGLIRIAEDFVLGAVTIFGHSVKINDFQLEKSSGLKADKGIIYRDTRFRWEVYRAKYLYNVGLAFALTKKASYSAALVDHILNWRRFSPFLNDNDAAEYNAMEASLRSINLSWLHFFLEGSEIYNDKVRKELIAALVAHLEYIYRNYQITTYGLESNHGLTCGVGLIHGAALFSGHDRSKKWLGFGLRILRRGLKTQFSKDGVNFENSTQYHRYTVELSLIAAACLLRIHHSASHSVVKELANKFAALESMTHTNSLISRIGDSDGGKVLFDLGSAQEFNNLEYLDWFRTGSTKKYYETLILEDLPQLRGIHNGRTRDCGRVGGYCYFKSSTISLIVSANNIGTKGKGNHQHNDFLSFELFGKSPFIVDSWSYCYSGDHKLRNDDRSMRAHNTVEIDYTDVASVPNHELFALYGSLEVYVHALHENDRNWYLIISHNGYRNLRRGRQNHVREFSIDKANHLVHITDLLEGDGDHEARISFHIPRRYWKLENAGGKMEFSNETEKFVLDSEGREYEIRAGYISAYFLNREPSYEVSLTFRYSGSARINSHIQYFCNSRSNWDANLRLDL